ncbi:MAG: magnesium/cobalt transporter CorA [Candidatus Bipolaricaulota bacterium]|nr:magnesium/cobalt transporter CorA [Candidatus Bipolaricaulota bacterium]
MPLRTFVYEEGQGLLTDIALPDLAAKIGQPGVTFWLDFPRPEAAEIQKMGELFNLHPLAVEDLINPQYRPKIDTYDNGLMIVLRDADVDRIQKSLSALELDLFLGRNFLITVHTERMECIEMTLARLNSSEARIIGRGPDYLAHTIIDLLVDDNLQLLSWLDEEINELEEAIFTNPDKAALQQAAKLRKNIVYLQRVLSPQLELIRRLSGDELPFIKKSLRVYFRDVYDNLARINDLIFTYREVISTDMAIHQALISNKLNDIMKTLTVIATIFLPLTFIASIYGMNFEFMPELSQPWGYPSVLALMLLIGGGMFWWFKRRGWFE